MIYDGMANIFLFEEQMKCKYCGKTNVRLWVIAGTEGSEFECNSCHDKEKKK